MQPQFKGWENDLDPEDFTLLSILNFCKTKADFSFNKMVEHTLVSKFVSYIAETTSKKWMEVASAINKDEILQVIEGVGRCQNNHLSDLTTRRVSYGGYLWWAPS
ncbi:12392_t:CDS:2 [Funneliformis geosporum]|uniref:12392_t:CDS:1 n=1 Tax=Funneliformis geosporum TaxID=1117311 RepID=A0A9W4WX40_9GLOM|nr:12392_t:CDS:2 [Funneliformis geosporum]